MLYSQFIVNIVFRGVILPITTMLNVKPLLHVVIGKITLHKVTPYLQILV